jgi:hypothetical protein
MPPARRKRGPRIVVEGDLSEALKALRAKSETAQQVGEQLARSYARDQARMLEKFAAKKERIEKLRAASFERDVHVHETALARHAENMSAPKGESGRPRILLTQADLLGLFERGLERARSAKKRRKPTYDEIADEYKLKRTWTTPIVKWAEAHQREARKAIVTSKIPPRFSALVRK